MAKKAKKQDPVEETAKAQKTLGDWIPKIPERVDEAAKELRAAKASVKRANKKQKEAAQRLDDEMEAADISIVDIGNGEFYRRKVRTAIEKVTRKKLREENSLPPVQPTEENGKAE